ncbi:hypothetical protein JOM56_008001 [Amanita muscaria]
MVWPTLFARLDKGRSVYPKPGASTGAPLKLTVLNAEERVWMMVAGGGASLPCRRLANHGGYSGAPSEGQTYEYAKTVRQEERRARLKSARVDTPDCVTTVEQPQENANGGATHPDGECARPGDQIIHFQRPLVQLGHPSVQSTRVLVLLYTVFNPVSFNGCSTLTTVVAWQPLASLPWSSLSMVTTCKVLEEPLLPVYTSLKEAIAKYLDAVMVVSSRSVYNSPLKCLTYPQLVSSRLCLQQPA